MAGLNPNAGTARQWFIGPVDDCGNHLAVDDNVGLAGRLVALVGFDGERLRLAGTDLCLVYMDDRFDRTLPSMR